MTKHYNDKEIIDAILFNNNKKVLSFLYDYNFESLNNKITSEGGSRKDTEDIFHDALMILFQKVKRKDFELTSSVHTFLQAIARNLWKRRLTKKANRFSKLNDDMAEFAEETLDEDYIQVERRKLYLRHLEDMPNDCKRLIKMVIDGFSLSEITKLIPYNSLEYTKMKRLRCKVKLIKKIINDPLYKELKNERYRAIGSIPRW